jgi:recombination protein RecT
MTTTTKPTDAIETRALAKLDEATVLTAPKLRALFDSALPIVQRALPAAMKKYGERMSACAVIEFQRNPLLAKATALSLLAATIQAAEVGLEIGGPMAKAYLVPYQRKIRVEGRDVWITEAHFQIGYHGMIELALRSPRVASVYAKVVREKDRFKLTQGTSPEIEHEPALHNAGAMIGAYGVVVLTGGYPNVEWMTRKEIEEHRDRYSQAWRSATSEDAKAKTPWGSAFNEMARKTVLVRVLKQCPSSAEVPEDYLRPDGEAAPAPRRLEPLDLPVLPAGLADEDRPLPPADSKAETETAAGDQAADPPEVTTADDFFKLLDRTKLTWGNAIEMVEKHFKVATDESIAFEDLKLEWRRWVVGELTKAAAKKAKGGT